MKKILHLIFIIFITLIFPNAKGQLLNFPYSCWQQRGVYNGGLYTSYLVDKNVTTYLYDTVVCSLTYKKCLFEQTSSGNPYPNTYKYFRNDNGKIYFCKVRNHPTCPDSSSLIFDFNLMPGDTFSFVDDCCTSPLLDTVASVTYVSIGGQQRKEITFKKRGTFIDGIGNSFSGIYYWAMGLEGEQYEIVCQKDSAGTVYTNPTITGPFSNDPSHHLHQCDSIPAVLACLYLGVNSEQINNVVFISPNPLTSSSILQLNTQLIPNESGAEVVIYDMVGKEILRKKLTGGRMEIEKGSLESGVYFVKVTSEEKQWVEKMMVE